jgi:hypothetical protein
MGYFERHTARQILMLSQRSMGTILIKTTYNKLFTYNHYSYKLWQDFMVGGNVAVVLATLIQRSGTQLALTVLM